MNCDAYPLQWLLLTFSGWVNRHQQQVIEYLVEENRILQAQLGGRRLRLTNEQRRRLAAKGVRLGRAVLKKVATIVTPDTILRWHRRLIARKWTFDAKRCGRPGVLKDIARLAVQMAEQNPSWGYSRIQGALKNLGHRVARSTIAKVLKDNGIEPAPNRPTSWRTFLTAHWGSIVGADFFTTEVWTPRGLMTYYVLFLIDLESRRVHLAGATPTPDDSFMAQVARNLTDAVDGFLLDRRFLICDRDAKFSKRFKTLLETAGVELVRTPYRAPNCNAYGSPPFSRPPGRAVHPSRRAASAARWSVDGLGRCDELKSAIAEDPELASRPDPDGAVPLYVALLRAARLENGGCLRTLLDAGADPSREQDERHFLTWALMVKQDVGLLEEFLDRGLDPEVANSEGMNALHLAVVYPVVDSARLPLERGADAAAKTAQGQTAADLARERREINVAKREESESEETRAYRSERIKTYEELLALLEGAQG